MCFLIIHTPRPPLYPCHYPQVAVVEMIKTSEGEATTGNPAGNLVAAYPTE